QQNGDVAILGCTTATARWSGYLAGLVAFLLEALQQKLDLLIPAKDSQTQPLWPSMSSPAVKSLPSAQTTPTQYPSLLCRIVSASDICAIIWGLNAFFFAALSMMILNTRS